mgnify:CR=1 FL=1
MVDLLDTREVGDTVRFESENFSSTPFNDSESLVDADTITITVEKRDGTKVVDEASIENHDTGQYFYEWDTTGLEATDYQVTVKAERGDVQEKTCGYIRLKECV